jgi:hypothetical protein
MAAMVGVHRDGGVVVIVFGEWAVPSTTPNAGGRWLSEVVEECGEVGAGEDVVDRPTAPILLLSAHRIEASVSPNSASAAVSTV